MRNFKFNVQITDPLNGPMADMGFTNVAGINMTTEVINYREGGWNTNYHKLPANTDFGPLTLIQGVIWSRSTMWSMAQRMFAVQWGGGTLLEDTQYRFIATVRVMEHPVTQGGGSGSVPGDYSGSRLAFKFYNAWVGSIAFNDLDAAGNAVLISQMTMHHEGFEVFWGKDAVGAGGATTGPAPPGPPGGI
jgi:phage tail-like protein